MYRGPRIVPRRPLCVYDLRQRSEVSSAGNEMHAHRETARDGARRRETARDGRRASEERGSKAGSTIVLPPAMSGASKLRSTPPTWKKASPSVGWGRGRGAGAGWVAPTCKQASTGRTPRPRTSPSACQHTAGTRVRSCSSACDRAHQHVTRLISVQSGSSACNQAHHREARVTRGARHRGDARRAGNDRLERVRHDLGEGEGEGEGESG